MARQSYDPFKDETLGTPDEPPIRRPRTGQRRRPKLMDWRGVARRIAEGEQIGAIAASLDLPEEKIWRHLHASTRFQMYLPGGRPPPPAGSAAFSSDRGRGSLALHRRIGAVRSTDAGLAG